MTPFRVLFVLIALSATGGVTYLGWSGVGGTSSDISTASVRTGSGGIYRVGSVK